MTKSRPAQSPYAKEQEPRMLALINSFPCLRRKGIATWNPVALAEESAPWSSSERLSVGFVLSVWNPDENPFDIHAALQKWDDGQRAAFYAWAQNPWWP